MCRDPRKERPTKTPPAAEERVGERMGRAWELRRVETNGRSNASNRDGRPATLEIGASRRAHHARLFSVGEGKRPC